MPSPPCETKVRCAVAVRDGWRSCARDATQSISRALNGSPNPRLRRGLPSSPGSARNVRSPPCPSPSRQRTLLTSPDPHEQRSADTGQSSGKSRLHLPGPAAIPPVPRLAGVPPCRPRPQTAGPTAPRRRRPARLARALRWLAFLASGALPWSLGGWLTSARQWIDRWINRPVGGGIAASPTRTIFTFFTAMER